MARRDDACSHSSMVAFGRVESQGRQGQATFDTRRMGNQAIFHPRKDATEPENFIEAVADHVSKNGLGLVYMKDVPTLQDAREAHPNYDIHKIEESLRTAVAEYQTMNTQLYHYVRALIDISGPHQQEDLR